MVEEEVKARIVWSFPGCHKYKHCCDESWDSKLENVKDIPQPTELATYNVGTLKKPEGFEDIKVSELG